MMMPLCKIKSFDLKQILFTISFLLLILRFSVLVDIIEKPKKIRSVIITNSSRITMMIDDIPKNGLGPAQNRNDLIIDEKMSIKNKNETNDSTDTSIQTHDSNAETSPNSTKNVIRPDYIRPKHGSDTEELGCLDQLPVKVLESGKQQMSNQKVIICGIARDNANDLPTMIKYMERTGQLFSDYLVVIFENDSVDGTKDILKDWEITNNKVKIITHDYHNVKRPAISFLAEARNYYLYEISNHSDIYHDYDMMMVVDMDMVYGWDMRGLYHSFSHVNDWDMICSNGVGHESGSMYDRFAFNLLNIGNKTRWRTRFYEPDSGLVPVNSCFGGLAFYKLSSINGCYYDTNSNACEHIPFHNCIKSQHKGRLFMNPTQIIRYSHYS